MTVNYLRTHYPEIFIIADAKRGDIGNTSKMYASAFFRNFDFDAVTVAPYMGIDSVSPFLEYHIGSKLTIKITHRVYLYRQIELLINAIGSFA
jgi:orotidine-5'-phosphate decarboxylase